MTLTESMVFCTSTSDYGSTQAYIAYRGVLKSLDEKNTLHDIPAIHNINAAHLPNPRTKNPGKNRCFDALVYILFPPQLNLPLPNLAVPGESEVDDAF